MEVMEVAGSEGVGWGAIGLIRLWKCVEKSKHAPFDVPNLKGMRYATQQPLTVLRRPHRPSKIFLGIQGGGHSPISFQE
jgi:hypothetical protein